MPHGSALELDASAGAVPPAGRVSTGPDSSAPSQGGLDPEQRSILDRGPEQSFAVIGAPGTGKTHALLELVADRVERFGLAPESILVLTPTRQSATRLRDRVALRLGIPSNGPLARTPTSAAFELVRQNAVATGRPVALLTGAEQDRVIADLIEGAIDDAAEGRPAVRWPDELPPEVRRLKAFRTELRELMMRATENGVSAEALEALGHRHEVAEWVSAAAFVRDYRAAIEGFEAARLDSAEILAEGRRLVRTGGGLSGVRLVVVDDFHDLPVGALTLVRELARRGTAVVAFGDPDAATAGFRGTDVRALGQLSRALGVPTAPPVVLRTSYRQRGALRDFTRRVTERIGTAAAGSQRDTRDALEAPGGEARGSAVSAGAMGAAPVQGAAADPDSKTSRRAEPGRDTSRRAEPGREAPRRAEPGQVLTIQADSRAAEISTIARLLRERHLLHDTDWSRMAVVVRSGALVPAFARGLALAEVPTRTLSAVQALRDDYAARHLVEAVALAIGRLEFTPEALQSVILGPLGGIDAVGLRRLRLALRHDELAAGGSRHADELLREAVLTPGVLAVIDSAPARRVAALGVTLQKLAQSHADGATIEELLWELWQRTGLAKRWGDLASGSGIVADEANRNLDGAVALFTSAKRSVEREPERPAALFIDEFLTAEVPEDTLSPRSRSGSVLVTTPTGAVGIDVEVVVVAVLQESVWPNLRQRGSLLHAQTLSALAEAGGAAVAAPGGVSVEVDLTLSAAGGAATDPDRAARERDGVEAHLGGPSAVSAPRTGLPADDTRADVLADELRMFALAVSRSTELTVLSCVANDDEQPSAFFGLAPDAGPVRVVRHPLTLRGTTGYLRRRLTEEGDQRAAAALARLAAEGVPGAHPAEWYGLLAASTDEPVVDPDDPDAVVRVSPSRIEAFESSPLIWFIDQVAGGSKGLAAGIGTIVHSVMEQVSADPDADLTSDELWNASQQRWQELRFEAPWIEEREKRALRTKFDGLSAYLRSFAASQHELVGAEATFGFRQGRAEVNGSIDRIERRADGTVVVIDLKTGKYPASARDLPRHAQLATYQLAVKSGAVEGFAPDAAATASGGAALLYVAKGERGLRFTVRAQDPLDDDALADIADRIEKVAEGMAAATFPGVADPEERDFQNNYDYRIQLIKAVSE
ncbi:PD-(D/E)XK nuclease family protein [Herbiconiux daphne]|uniref:DNA 3'-5' helicase n=1 Tax=Herbiconiux daphne TaxID=2970914 RepID=A0ABT2H2R6_9MICO|nr:PD-(D/E)XK nuclease family protein [Herbiconiux daphne]MCS5734186.1 PD-(D/E)XK nuclease family protein [Herbiconiux daphne]